MVGIAVGVIGGLALAFLTPVVDALQGTRGARKDSTQLAEIAKELVCGLQGEFANHSVTGIVNYNVLIEALKLRNHAPDPANKAAAEAAEEVFHRELLQGLKHAFTSVQNKLQKYFENRPGPKPRFTITLLRNNGRDVKHLFRPRGRPVHRAEEYTAYSYFRKRQPNGSRYFHCNDIPAAVRSPDGYRHPRLRDSAKDYREHGRLARLVRKWRHQQPDDWNVHWNPYQTSEQGAPLCYKSTLVVPIGFENNELDKKVREFISHVANFEPAPLATQREELGPPVFGYLTLDHEQCDYFKAEEDAAMLFLAADMLSLFLLFRRLILHTPTLTSLGMYNIPDFES